jgi:toxin ParE1/3/4
MQIRWAPKAADALEAIVDYIGRDNPVEAQRVGQEIYNRVSSLLGTFPRGGRRGRVKDTRELPLPPLPFIVVYRATEHADAVEIVNVIHGAQRWPPVG